MTAYPRFEIRDDNDPDRSILDTTQNAPDAVSLFAQRTRRGETVVLFLALDPRLAEVIDHSDDCR